jgi:DNA topoisomerase-1
MEGELDKVEDGEVEWRTLLADFYPGFLERLEAGEVRSDEIIKEILAAEGETCDKCGRPMLVRWNRFGRFLGCSGYPECKNTRSLDGVDQEGKELGPHPQEARAVRLKFGPYGPYVELASPTEDEKPKRVSIPKERDPGTVDLEYAVKLLELPRTVGADPTSGDEIVAAIGRFGPFVRRDKTFASLKGTDALWTVTLEEAVELLDAKASGKRVPLRELGKHPESGADIVILSGRYGPYVTDGTVNATLPKGSEPEEVDLEEAVKMIALKAARGGGRRGGKARGAGTPRAKKGAAKASGGGRRKKAATTKAADGAAADGDGEPVGAPKKSRKKKTKET